ncbi:OSB2, chloroplastic-like protein, partial [Tanacetum coccineum]
MVIFRINLTFWDEMAHIASQHVEKGQQIYVSGRLVSDAVDSDDGKQQTYYKVVVSQLNFVERSAPSAPSYDGDFNSGYNSNSNSNSNSNFLSNSNSSSMTTGNYFYDIYLSQLHSNINKATICSFVRDKKLGLGRVR